MRYEYTNYEPKATTEEGESAALFHWDQESKQLFITAANGVIQLDLSTSETYALSELLYHRRGELHRVIHPEDFPLRHCPQCGQDYRAHPAISRVDDKTQICPECGTKAAQASRRQN